MGEFQFTLLHKQFLDSKGPMVRAVKILEEWLKQTNSCTKIGRLVDCFFNDFCVFLRLMQFLRFSSDKHEKNIQPQGTCQDATVAWLDTWHWFPDKAFGPQVLG